MSVSIETQKGVRAFSSDIEVTKQGKAFAENQRTGECFDMATECSLHIDFVIKL